MELENVKNYGDLVEFFNEREFRDYNEEFREFNVSKLYKIRLKEIDRFPESVAEWSWYRKELKEIGQNVIYYLLYTKEFDKFCFMRQVGDPFKFTCDKNRTQNLPTETRLSLLNKLKGLKYKDDIFNETLENLFDVKEIVKKFFEEYKGIIKRLSKDITIEKVNPELYAQVLMDRIIFLYFLQTKGVLDKKYLSDRYSGKDKDINYYINFLRPLFFDVLNKEHDMSKEVIIKDVDFGKVPYLNGGLFREKDFENESIKIKNDGWKDVFDLLNKYEWVVEEQKGDSTVLTPAILGHIYEKSVIAATQKETGSYYTPEEITNYISMNTIYPYITDRINEKFGTKYRYIYDELLKKKDQKKDHGRREIEMIRFLYFDVLKKLTILDNACGSGAFLVAALYVLIPIYRTCSKILAEKDKENFKKELKEIANMNTVEYYIKRTIITNNLYGVDIQEGAVEICKLRLWLSMVSDVDKNNIEPLPNIDYNIMCGNSLIGFVEAPIDEQFGLFELEKIEPEQRTLTEPKEYQARMEIKTVKEIMRTKGMFVNEYKKTKNSKQAEELKKNIENINEKFRPVLNEKLLREFRDKKIKIEKEELEKLNPFHWGFEFYDVFDPEKPAEERGFDVVIGNPPYGNILSEIEKEIIHSTYKYSTTSEIASPFIEKSQSILKNTGNFSFIITFAITFSKELSKSRELIFNSFEKASLYNFDRDKCRIFSSMSQSVSILVCYNKNKEKHNGIFSSILYREMPDLYKLKTENTTNFLLGNRGFVSIKEKHRLPKLGEKINVDILEKLLRFDKTIDYTINKSGKKLWIRTSGNYWYNAWDREPYKSTKIKPIFINQEYYDIILLLFNSSLFYFWFRIFGDGRDTNSDIYMTIPVLDEKIISSKTLLLKKMREKFLNDLFSKFDSERNRFLTSKVKWHIDLIDLVLGKLYGLSYTEISHILNYDYQVRKGNNLKSPIKEVFTYLVFLNETEERRNSEKELIEFFDTQIIDSLVYEIYFDELKTNLINLVSPYLADISSLISSSEKLNAIKEVYDNLIHDKEILNLINEIKSHKWVKIIENE
ncbi:MAG: hypothetical protein CVT89_00455 [Candidatus Altiarchaeales archaeon HGW-Altiarchaeales-2]|nr:MAG: hypothetical protein CVT89_00455 [Candidatus Altiarchaeales archaeon HGW-Altiarchaeales-2]